MARPLSIRRPPSRIFRDDVEDVAAVLRGVTVTNAHCHTRTDEIVVGALDGPLVIFISLNSKWTQEAEILVAG
jgi:hypothetical protein